MGDMGDYWRDVKEHYRQKQNKYEHKIASDYNYLCGISKKVGDHNRIGIWDFWHTGTVRNIKTGEVISISELRKLTRNLR